MATYTQSTNIDPYKAVYGTRGQDVLSLQQELNKFGAGLKEDSMYGPLTQAAYNKYKSNLIQQPQQTQAQQPQQKTLDEVFKYEIPTQPTGYAQYEDILAKQARGEDIVDTTAIRQEQLNAVQDRINALKQVYAQQLAKAQQEGVGRVGSGTAILASRGLAGSTRGEAIKEGVLDYNRQIENSILAEQNAAISSILMDAENSALAEAQRRRESLTEGAKSYIEFLKGQDERKSNNIDGVVTQLITQGIDPSTMTPDQINELATKLGTNPNTIISRYKTATYVPPQKRENIKLSEGQAEFAYNPETGEYEKVASLAKTYAPKSPSTSNLSTTISPSKYTNDLDAIIGNTVATIPTKFGQEQFQTQLSKTRNDADKINLIGSVVLKNAPAPVKQDFANQSIAVSNIDKAIAEIDSGAKSGFINNKLQKGFNLVGRDYDPALASIASYITSAVQPYRNSVTGAAWGSQEEAEYAQLFGSTAYSPKELRERLVRLKEIMKDKSAQGLNVFVNPLQTYDNPFITSGESVTPTQQGGTVTVYSIKTGNPAEIPAENLQQALSSGLFRE